jgi:hypothetical protein
MVVGFGAKVQPNTARALVIDAIVHPLSREDLRGHDLAVLSIAETVDESDRPAAQILSARQFAMRPPARLEIVGYGLSSPAALQSAGTRFRSHVSVASPVCTEPWANAAGCASFNELILSDVLGSAQGQRKAFLDTCPGDSGGPAFLRGVPGRRVLVGITSRSVLGAGSLCGEGGIYGIPGTIPNLRWLSSLVPDLQVVAD